MKNIAQSAQDPQNPVLSGTTYLKANTVYNVNSFTLSSGAVIVTGPYNLTITTKHFISDGGKIVAFQGPTLTAATGAAGTGQTAQPGGNGPGGLNAGNVTITSTTLKLHSSAQPLVINTSGQNGGNGGPGGAPGAGGNAGKISVQLGTGNPSKLITATANWGNGGKGGSGGSGGDGGLGGEPADAARACSHIPQHGPQGPQGDSGTDNTTLLGPHGYPGQIILVNG